jgi:tetratricopeptide (TPR) repeat protein
MDGRRIQAWLIAGGMLAASASGCKTTKQPVLPDGAMGQAANTSSKGSFLGFGGESKFVPKPPAPETVVAKARVKGKGIKPETELAFADTEMESALAEGKSQSEREALFDVARQRYQKVLQGDPKNRTAMIGLARLYTHSGDKARATQLYDSAIKANPKDHDLAFQKARMLARFEDWNGAVAACQTAQGMDPENLKYPKAIAYYKAQAGQWDEAFAILLKRMPEADARFFLGRVLLDLDRIEEGREQMVLAMKADPKHADAGSVLAMLESPPATGGEKVQQAGFQNNRR